MKKIFNPDETDLQIIKELQINGKTTNLELSKKIALSPAPTFERVKKLEKNGIIKSYHAEVNERELGIGVQTFMLVSLVRNKKDAVQSFVRQINAIPEIVECYHVTGSSDYVFKIMVKDMPDYEKLAVEKIGNISEIANMQTMMILSCIKKSKVIPVDYE